MKRSHTVHILLVILLLGSSVALHAQDSEVRGTVTAASDGLSIPGVTVVVPGTSVGTITNLEGQFTLSIPGGQDTLEFRFVGMETQRVALAGRAVIDIQMAQELYTVDEVVVTALGISRDAKSLGYSATAVGSDELTEGSNTSALNALQGKVAGVNITSASGAPGASTRVLMRGVTSLTGGNQPLFVIDGVPVSNAASGSSSINGGTDFGNKMNDINPEDIESMTILKGASGTALYGSRAANGVIIIKTKQGKLNSKATVTVNSSLMFERPLRLVQYQNHYGQGIGGDAVLYENMSWGPTFDNQFRPWGHNVDNTLRVKAYRALPNNVEEFFETGVSYNNSIAFNGGNDKSTYYLSYSNVDWDGIFPGSSDSYTRHTLSLRSSYQITKRLVTSASMNYVRKDNSSVPTGQGEGSVYNQVMQTPRDISLLELANLEEEYNNVNNHYSLYTLNPYHILENNGNENQSDRLYGNVAFDYSILESLKMKWNLGGDLTNQHRKSWAARVEPEGNNEFSAVFTPGSVSRSSLNQSDLNSDLLLTFNKSFKNWEYGALVGYTINQKTSSGHGSSVSYLNIDGFYNLSNSTEDPSASEAFVQQRMLAVNGNVDVAYKRMLFLAASLRNEWSSTLPPENNSYFFPGVNFGFIFSELMPNLKSTFPYGKLRASWARVGNDAAPYQVYSVFQRAGHSDGFGYLGYPINGVSSFDVGNLLANDQLKPEITDEYEIGTDLRFYNNRIAIDFAYYHKATTNLIWPTPVASSSGYVSQMQNLGKITNKGVESLVTFVPVRKSNFQWQFGVNFTKNNNELNYLTTGLESAELNALRIDGGQQISWVAIPGKPIGVFQARAPKYTNDGRMIVDNNGLPVADEELKTYGDSQFKYFGGVSNSLNYKNISLSFQLDFRKGGLMYSRTKNITHWAGTVPATLYNDRKPFIVPNAVVEVGEDENGNPIYEENTKPIDATNLTTFWGNGGYELDGNSFIDKSFIKLREVVLSYGLPESVCSRLMLEKLELSVVGKNLLLFTPASQTFIDPEATTFGNDLRADFGEYGAQPSTRSVSVNLRAVF